MAVYTTIDDSSEHFQIDLYTGTGSSLANTFDGNAAMQPDWVWIKERNGVADHAVYDSNRGVQKQLEINDVSVESTESTGLTAFGSDGFTVGGLAQVNTSSDTYVAWAWKGAGGTTSTNNDGAVTSTVQVNSTAGFSILTYTMNSNSNETVGHGLGVAPDIVITKARERGDSNGFWSLYTTLIDGSLDYLKLNDTTTLANSSLAAPTSTVFTGAGSSTASYRSFVAYCFKSIQGFSRFGIYEGNGNSDGPFIYTGFKPALVIVKNADGTTNWRMNGPDGVFLSANTNEAVYDSGNGPIDRLSNGFKIRGGGDLRENHNTFIYMAWASNPFVTSTGVPTTAGVTGTG